MHIKNAARIFALINMVLMMGLFNDLRKITKDLQARYPETKFTYLLVTRAYLRLVRLAWAGKLASIKYMSYRDLATLMVLECQELLRSN